MANGPSVLARLLSFWRKGIDPKPDPDAERIARLLERAEELRRLNGDELEQR